VIETKVVARMITSTRGKPRRMRVLPLWARI
jgi:hypothetical protein